MLCTVGIGLAPRYSGTVQRPTVTVIVPTKDRGPLLSRCLESLRTQTYPSELVQLLVVDNGSETDLTEWVGPRVELAREPRPGSYAARNHGIRQATGEVLAFTDSDCVPHRNWIERGVQALWKADAVAGDVRFAFTQPHCPSAFEVYDSLTAITQQYFVEQEGFGATANFFVWRRVVNQLGPFEEDTFSGGDLEWGQRLQRHGLTLRFAPDVVVQHPARSRFGELVQRTRRTFAGRFHLRKMGVQHKTSLSRTRLVGLGIVEWARRGHWWLAFQVFALAGALRIADAWESIRQRRGLPAERD